MGSVDAFSRAILNEKDPVIRGYMENLRAQIAAIAAKHGANARGVWDRAVQDRMSLPEMERVNALFARIRDLAAKNVSRVEMREMETELDEKESAARAMIAEALAMDIYSDAVDAIGKMFLGADMLDNANDLCDDRMGDIGNEFAIDLYLARARRSEIESARETLGAAITMARTMITTKDLSFDVQLKMLLKVFDPYLAAASDAEVRSLPANLMTYSSPAVLIAIERVSVEFIRRGLQQDGDYLVMLAAAGRLFQSELSEDDRIDYRLGIVDVRRAAGQDVRYIIDSIFTDMRGQLRPRISFRISEETFNEAVIKAAEIGAYDVIETLRSDPSWQELVGAFDVNVRLAAAIGCVDAGDIEKAVEYLRLETDALDAFYNKTVRYLVVDLLKKDDLERAMALNAELTGNARMENYRHDLGYLAARARRGENVLAEARGLAARVDAYDPALDDDDEGDSPVPLADQRAIILATAGIATLWNVVELRKKTAEYEKR